jgi:thiazole tautomerase (transcriptional regulator TenI)
MKELHVLSSGNKQLARFAEIAGEIHPYVTAFHLREKNLSALELWSGIERLCELGVPRHKIVVNDRIDVAWAAKTGGVHLASHSLPVLEVRKLPHGLRIGRSVHSPEEALQCQRDGADYVFFGHIFASSSKPGLAPRGLLALEEVVGIVSIPVIAIGGIGPLQAESVLQRGAAGIAVISGILDAQDPYHAAKTYHDIMQKVN